MAMSESPFVCVIDANVVLKLYQKQAGSDKTDALFALLVAQPDTGFYVPDLFYAECTNAFAQYVRLAGYPAEEARRDMIELRALGLRVVPNLELAATALDIAIKHHVSGYDAYYVALAARVKAPFITADEKLVRNLAGKEYRVHSLATFEIPPSAAVD